MAGKPLYLVRRELYRFVGPMTLSELRTAYRKMEVGPQDEVCGHCGVWVPLDQMERLRTRYPEVAELVGDENSSGWAVSVHGEQRLDKSSRRSEKRSEKKPLDKRATPDSRSSDNGRRVGFALLFLGVACLAAGAAWFLARSAQNGKGADDSPGPKVADAAAFLQKNDVFGFMAFIDGKSAQIIPRVLRAKSAQTEWLPYLRAYAFMQQGQIAGVPSRLLKGDAPAVLPQDCAVSAWTTRWTQSLDQWSAGAAGSRFVKTPWMQVLAWDPYYLARRKADGWISHKNYMEACLVMAAKSLDLVAADLEKQPNVKPAIAVSLKVMRKRLQWEMDVVQGRSVLVTTPAPPRDALEAMTCMESAGAMDVLLKCREFKPATEGWSGVLLNRFSWSFARLAVPRIQRGEGGSSLREDLGNQLARLQKGDGLTGLEQVPELGLVREVMRRHVAADDDVLKQKDAGADVDLRGLAGF